MTSSKQSNPINTDHSVIDNIKRPILLPAALLIALLLIVFFYTLYSQEIKNSNENMLKIIASVEQSFLRKVDQRAFYLASQIYFFQNSSCIISSLSKRDKEQLKVCSVPIIEQLQDTFELHKLNYVDLEKNYILSIDTTDIESSYTLMHADKSHSFITKKSINTQQNSYGIELSYDGHLQLIMSFPLLSHSQIIGYVEMITDISTIFHALEDSYNISLFTLVEKHYMKMMGAKPFFY